MQTETRLKDKRYDDRYGNEMAEINLQNNHCPELENT